MKAFNVGVIGYGWAAGAHIDAINATSLAQVAQICSSRPLDPAELQRRHGSGVTPASSLEAMLRDPSIHAVSICSYPQDHARHAVAAARAGKHIILEKPIALELADMRAVQQAVCAAGVKVCVCLECRYSSQFLATKAVLDWGLLGRVHYGEVDYYHGIGPWYGQFRWNVQRASAGSSLFSAGCHALDALLLCMGTDVLSVQSLGTKSADADFAKYEYPSTSVTLLHFTDGRVGKVTSCIDCHQPYYFHVHLVGSEGSLLDNKFHSRLLPGLNKSHWSELSMKMLDSGDVSDHPYQTQFQVFFESLQRGVEMPLTDLKQAVLTHEVMFAADRAAAEGRIVKLSEVHAE